MIKLIKQIKNKKKLEANLELKEDKAIQKNNELLILLYSNYFKYIKKINKPICQDYSNLKEVLKIFL